MHVHIHMHDLPSVTSLHHNTLVPMHQCMFKFLWMFMWLNQNINPNY